ncbi:uncharacterized protein MAM_04182 [Metarhizium album ARSEF 1941]|uniref:Indole-diterpene biosynthesis protein PaxU n=1 Tax=Metarhizium album (strain ARSEF 1941) TaxID=1081103 RepID=A0A0B2WUP9_METAS|nr:uncharacterized protein MAM_04182 [Metarhizium album ARSEF 1941]KHN97793.1 hypothetical protein MAM_04182 [Metarhizium album ARSEF 1941]
MSSKPKASTPPKAADKQALSWMRTLSPAVSYYDPHPASPTHANEPHLILILSWMGARPVHISKYALQYRKTYPSSRILIAQCPITHIVFPWRTRAELSPALPYLRDLSERQQKADDAGDTSPRLLIQIFSNGGIHTASYLRRMLRGAQPHGTPVLPRYVLVFDSCPGYFRWMSSYNALMQMLPRWSGPVVHTAIALVCLYHFLRRLPAIQNRNARALRSPGLLAREASRTYLYGTADALILWQDVEDNARKASEAGFATRLEKFVGAKHVDLMRADPERYWKAIQTSWMGEPEPRVGAPASAAEH